MAPRVNFLNLFNFHKTRCFRQTAACISILTAFPFTTLSIASPADPSPASDKESFWVFPQSITAHVLDDKTRIYAASPTGDASGPKDISQRLRASATTGNLWGPHNDSGEAPAISNDMGRTRQFLSPLYGVAFFPGPRAGTGTVTIEDIKTKHQNHVAVTILPLESLPSRLGKKLNPKPHSDSWESVFRWVCEELKTSCGVEYAKRPLKNQSIGMDFKNTTQKAILNELVRQMPDYRWTQDGETINLLPLPKKGWPDGKPGRDILDRKMTVSISTSGGGNVESAVRWILSEAGISDGRHVIISIGMPQPRVKQSRASLSIEKGMTVRECLNRAVRTYGPSVWHFGDVTTDERGNTSAHFGATYLYFYPRMGFHPKGHTVGD